MEEGAMTVMLAVDPGDEHCGMAVFVDRECRWTGEMRPEGLYDWLSTGAALWAREKLRWDVIVVEEFRLYPGAAATQTWSSFGTVEVIGVLKEYGRRENVAVVMQPASAKKPVRAILKAKGVKLKGRGDHAKDAELHGWHYLLAKKGETHA
jgi:hypothetical protein